MKQVVLAKANPISLQLAAKTLGLDDRGFQSAIEAPKPTTKQITALRVALEGLGVVAVPNYAPRRDGMYEFTGKRDIQFRTEVQ